METEMVQYKESQKISNLPSPCLEDHMWFGDSKQLGKVNCIRLGYLKTEPRELTVS